MTAARRLTGCGRRLGLALAALALGLLGAGGTLLWSSATTAQALVADLSSHLIAITTGFTGTEVVLFGAVDGPGEVAVVVLGPKARVTVRRKERLAGLWMNRRAVVFEQVPGFYALATSRPLDGLAPEPVLARHGIGLDRLVFNPAGGRAFAPADLAAFREALVRAKLEAGLYAGGDGQVTFLGKRLFRTNLFFPATVATGTYTVSVFLFRDRDVVSAQTTPLIVGKTGVGAELSEFAQRRPVWYGLAAVFGACLIGWGAGTLLGRS
ncbi:MAG: TIGR02186 family protein [Rhodospirillaceae bacterium]